MYILDPISRCPAWGLGGKLWQCSCWCLGSSPGWWRGLSWVVSAEPTLSVCFIGKRTEGYFLVVLNWAVRAADAFGAESGSKGEMLELGHVTISVALQLPKTNPTCCWRWLTARFQAGAHIPLPAEQQAEAAEAQPVLRVWAVWATVLQPASWAVISHWEPEQANGLPAWHLVAPGHRFCRTVWDCSVGAQGFSRLLWK